MTTVTLAEHELEEIFTKWVCDVGDNPEAKDGWLDEDYGSRCAAYLILLAHELGFIQSSGLRT